MGFQLSRRVKSLCPIARVILTTLDATGIAASEPSFSPLKVEDIDSQRMAIHVWQGED
ncbi:MAG TPA: hypothetical protein VFY29_03355 [Terriglobia bacterium]|nr:hypothetical protein [Terriglobia bacterium]